MMRYVIDTSIVIPWFFTDQESAERCLAVRDDIAHDPERYCVPDLLYSELAHVASRLSGGDSSKVRQSLLQMAKTGVPARRVRGRMLDGIAHWAGKGLSGYDATFVALAEDIDGSWLTMDERAARKIRSGPVTTLRRWKPAPR